MAHNLKKFATEADYNSATLNYPAVSWIVAGNTVICDKSAPFNGLTVFYNITQADTQTEVGIFNGGGGSSESESGGGGSLPTSMIVDGVAETPINGWRFETAGQHIIQYTFANNIIPKDFLSSIILVTSVIIGNDITEIGGDNSNGAFMSCSNLTAVTIGSGVTNIGENAFRYSENLTSITVNSTEPPIVNNNAFDSTNNCPIYVPSAYVDVYKASTATGWSAYASRIQAIA